MGWFGNGHDKRGADAERIAALEAEVGSLRKQVAAAVASASEAAERAYRYMKKAEARARREADEPNQEPAAAPEGGALVTPARSASRRALWGARGRRMRRGDPLHETNESNGVHP